MLERSSVICHKSSGVTIQTPLLIPSFSSKGFARSKNGGKSEINKILAASGEFITEAFLISAYDIFYGHVPYPREMSFTPEIIFLDSGGYEISTDKDYSSVIDPLPASEPWDTNKFESILDIWPDEMPTIIVSFDHHEKRKSIVDQLNDARHFIKKYPKHLHLFLVKPETIDQMLLDKALKNLIANITQLNGFDIIGVTEKELGHSMLDRMVQVARLRLALDEAEIKIPIHVFGALDPISVCLFFISGAEIFDGLTWIRYGYEDGRCIYTHNLGVLKYSIDARDDTVKARVIANNYYYLLDLQRRLKEYEATKKMEKLYPHERLVSNALDSLSTRLKRRL